MKRLIICNSSTDLVYTLTPNCIELLNTDTSNCTIKIVRPAIKEYVEAYDDTKAKIIWANKNGQYDEAYNIRDMWKKIWGPVRDKLVDIEHNGSNSSMETRVAKRDCERVLYDHYKLTGCEGQF